MNDTVAAQTDTLIFNPKISQLNPIYVPEPIPFEPLTIGWYILFGLGIFIVLFFLFKRFRKYQLNAYRRYHIAELTKLVSNKPGTNVAQLLQTISTVLKSVAFISYSRERVAGLYGEEWGAFLISTHPAGEKFSGYYKLLNHQYESGPIIEQQELQGLLDASIDWVRRHHV